MIERIDNRLWQWRWAVQRWWYTSLLARKRCWYCGHFGRLSVKRGRLRYASGAVCRDNPSCFARAREVRCSQLRHGPELDHCVLEEGHDGRHIY